MHTITFANQKGGVGKSTLACHFAFDLRERGYNVLFLDLDAQGNSSTSLRHLQAEGAHASGLFEQGATLPAGDGLTVIAADDGLVNLDRAEFSVIVTLRDTLAGNTDYDWCVIDTPPTIGLRLSAALIVSDYVLAPIEFAQYSIDGIAKLVRTIYGVQQKANPDLAFIGLLGNRFDPRDDRQKATLKEIMGIEAYKRLLIKQPIGIRKAIPEALTAGQPVWELGKTSARDASKQVREAFTEIHARIAPEATSE